MQQMRLILIPLIILFFLSSADSAGQSGMSNANDSAALVSLAQHLKKDPDDINSIIDYCSLLIKIRDYPAIEPYAERLLQLGDSLGNAKATAYGAMLWGHVSAVSIKDNTTNPVYYYDIALKNALAIGDHRAISSIYNGMGIYAADVEMDHFKALSYFLKALPYASKSQREDSYIMTIYNIALAYCQRNDPSGLPYAEEVYTMALEQKRDFMVYMGAYILSRMHFFLKDYEQALHYIHLVLDHNPEDINISDMYLYSHYADILAVLGRDSEAVKNYELALSKVGTAEPDAAVMTYLSYGTYLVGRGNNIDAIPLLKAGSEISEKLNNGVYRYKLNRQLSRAYSNIGDYRTALRFYQEFQMESDSIFNIERERSINEMRIKYESEKTERELQQKELIIVRSQKRMQAMLLTLAVIVTVLIAIYVLYRRKNKMYKQIVLRQQDFLRQQKRLEDKLKKQSQPDMTATMNGGSEEKMEKLYEQLEYLMQNGELYKEKDLTRDKLARKLNTNRTYLSRALSEQAGQTFYSYINSYRINEALKTLSDVSVETPIKALAEDLGYNSLSTFHTAFENMIGMSPSRYRKKVMELHDRNSR